ncbi:MAG TPA: class I SAM-dependent methyltransferase [Mycobacterium sp.]|nr:class I SAM-dependent methyltransferase [Mycobacterium sp.]
MLKLETAARYARGCAQIPGFFYPADFMLFDFILAQQLDSGVAGDMLEIGVYRGKSAILMGCGLRPDERLIACDLFEKVMSHEDITVKHRETYGGLDVAEFCRNWNQYHSRQQLDVRICDSAQLTELPPLRFIHIDGCHNYKCVRGDIKLAAEYTGPRGVISLDDYRVTEEPGVAAAISEAVGAGELFPFCASDMKLYAATNNDDQAHWAAVLKTLPGVGVYSLPDYDVITVAMQVSQPIVFANLLFCMPGHHGGDV